MKKIIGVLIVLIVCSVLIMPVLAEEPKISVSIPHEVNDGSGDQHWPPRAGDYFNVFIKFIPEYFTSVFPPIPVFWDLYAYTDAQCLHIFHPEDPCFGSGEGSNKIYCDGINPMDYIKGVSIEPVFRIFADETTPPIGVHALINFIGSFKGTVESHDCGEYECGESNFVSVQVPEFPSPILPATAIIGFLGAVLLIQRVKKN